MSGLIMKTNSWDEDMSISALKKMIFGYFVYRDMNSYEVAQLLTSRDTLFLYVVARVFKVRSTISTLLIWFEWYY